MGNLMKPYLTISKDRMIVFVDKSGNRWKYSPDKFEELFVKPMQESDYKNKTANIEDLKLLADENQRHEYNGIKVRSAKDFLLCHGEKNGVSDEKLLRLATEAGYTIITRDKGFITLAVTEQIPIIYSERNQFWLTKGERIR